MQNTLPPPSAAPLRSPDRVALGNERPRGLDLEEAADRLARTGPNELPPPRRQRWPGRLVRQLTEPMSLLLMVAAGVSGIGLREVGNAVAILAIVVLNAVIGLVQEGKAAQALDALKRVETPLARVVRSGVAAVIPSREVVPGDLVLLAAGDRVPADAELMEAAGLEVDESLLTGESLPVAKLMANRYGPVAGGVGGPPDGDAGAVFAGTLVTRGTGAGLVVETGPRTRLGAIAQSLRAPEGPTPLQVELGRVSARLGAIAVLIAAGVFGLTLLRMGVTHESLQRSFLAAVALAVAAVPEGLVTVVVVGLALGVRRMAARGAIVRRLPAVETLGSTTVVLTDKTGTLTENRMRLESVALPGRDPIPPGSLAAETVRLVAEVAVLCNDATAEPPSGDPLEWALLEAFGLSAERLRLDHPRLAELPFDSERRMMTTLHQDGEATLLLAKGAPETVLDLCTSFGLEGPAPAPLTAAVREGLMATVDRMADRGMRVLALARRRLDGVPEDLAAAQRDLTFVALVGLRDPVRPEASTAVAEARSAGVRLVMVTGDHAGTAGAVAEEVGLREGTLPTMTGAELAARGLPSDPAGVAVYARVDPSQKLELVRALQDAGEVVAVTGDGVNDAPALRRADIGVAMGGAGSDVAREASDMVITDDNLATIVTAIREGRGIYDNIRKVVDYLVAGNLSEITVVVASLLLFPALGVPLLPIQLLWINLLTDGLPAIALGLDPADPALMSQPPRSREDRLLRPRHISLLMGRAVLMASASVGSLAVARFAWSEPWPRARAVMFTVLVTAHLLYAYAVRRPGTASNPWLLGAVGGGIALQAAIVLWPAMHSVFATRDLGARDWLLSAVLGVVPVAVMGTIAGWRAGTLRRAGRRAAATLGGGAVLVAGLVMLMTPGPGVATVLAGLAILSTEYAWAHRMLHRIKEHGRRAVSAIRPRRRRS